jgi:hypothetical protein
LLDSHVSKLQSSKVPEMDESVQKLVAINSETSGTFELFETFETFLNF